MRTTREISGQIVAIDCVDRLVPLARDALQSLAAIAATSKKPLKDLRVRFGWSLLGLAEEDGTLVVCEPDFDGDPLRQMRPGVDITLTVLAQQTMFLRRVHVSPFDVAFDQFVVVTPEAAKASQLVMTRSQATAPDDSGWYFAEMKQAIAPADAATLGAIRVFNLLLQHPGSLQALVLPPGFVVELENERIASVRDPDGRDRLSGENLQSG